MKTKLAVIALGIGICAYSWAACPKPTDANVCSGNQDAMCSNGCVKITGDGTKNRDCSGDGSSVNCVPGSGTAGDTTYTYAMLDSTGKQTTARGDCATCGSTLLSGPTAGSVNCRTANDGTDPCPAQG